MKTKNALITGASRRIGAAIARQLHAKGMRVMIHYNGSEAPARALCDELNTLRPDSARIIQANLSDLSQVECLAKQALEVWGSVDILVNNASNFFRTSVTNATLADWDSLMNINARAPFFLSQFLAPSLAAQKGCIVNIIDIHAEKRPMRHYAIYTIAKSALQMMTYALAQELAPNVRVNGVSPGMIVFPEGANELSDVEVADVLSRNVLKREGHPDDIAKAVLFLVESADYITGHVLAVDGGRLLNC
jgi:pteridine reductase